LNLSIIDNYLYLYFIYIFVIKNIYKYFICLLYKNKVSII